MHPISQVSSNLISLYPFHRCSGPPDPLPQPVCLPARSHTPPPARRGSGSTPGWSERTVLESFRHGCACTVNLVASVLLVRTLFMFVEPVTRLTRPFCKHCIHERIHMVTFECFSALRLFHTPMPCIHRNIFSATNLHHIMRVVDPRCG